VRTKLDGRGLAELRERPDVVQACRTLGFDQLFMPAVSPEQRQSGGRSGAGWGERARRDGRVHARPGDRLRVSQPPQGLAPKEGAKTALELIFEEAARSPLAWQVDIAWLVRGGADPKEWMQRYRDRVVSAHVKDIAPQGRNDD
jgi:sugar phosphate isomerase/epimerase